MHLSKHLATTVATVALVAGFSGASLAATPQEITDALANLYKTTTKGGGTLTLGTPTEKDGALVYTGVTIASPADEKAEIKTLTLTHADLKADGSVAVDDLKAEGITATSSGSTITIDAVELINPVFAPVEIGARVDSIAIDKVTASQPGKPAFAVDSFGLDFADFSGGIAHSLDLSVEGLSIDPNTAEASKDFGAQLKALGYDKLLLNFYATGSIDQSNGELSIDEITIDGADMGTLTLAGVFGGVTDDVLRKLMTPRIDPDPALLKQLTVKEASVYYGDASLAGRLIAMQAKDMGQEPAAFVDQITAALPLMLSMIGNQPFQDKLAQGATTFLKDPKNLAVSISPDQPVPVADLMSTAQTAPQTLPDLLKADVAANQQEDMDSDGTGGTGGGDAQPAAPAQPQ